MNLLSGTTWQFNGSLIPGTITFQQVGPDPRAGTVIVNWGQGNSITGTYAQGTKDNQVVIIYAPFMAAADGSYPPPYGIPTINADGESGDPIPVVLAGSLGDSNIGVLYCTNTVSACRPSGSMLASVGFSMVTS